MYLHFPRMGVVVTSYILLSLSWVGRQAFGADEPKPRLVIEHAARVDSLALAPDGKSAASACKTNVTLWDVASAKALVKMDLPRGGARGLAFSPDGKQLACGTERDGIVRVWDAGAAKEVLTIETGHARLFSLACSPDGKQLATCGDNDVKLWDAKNGRLSATLQGHGNQVWSVAFSPDSKRLALASCCGQRTGGLRPPVAKSCKKPQGTPASHGLLTPGWGWCPRPPGG
jgi:WD40 repeat protein